MGISYPYMAILSIAFFIIAVTGVLFGYLYIVDRATRTPMLGVYAESYIQNSKMVIIITTRHMRGDPVRILSIYIHGENKLDIIVQENKCFSSEDPFVDCYLIGFSDTRLLQGGVGKVLILLPVQNIYFYEGKNYRGIVIFDQGTYPITFTPTNFTSLIL
ncbi:MAG: hypothetical protein QXE81_02745 [Desulfurococcaceae archaeon]